MCHKRIRLQFQGTLFNGEGYYKLPLILVVAAESVQ